MRCESRQNRLLEAVYPIVYVDSLVVKGHEHQRIINLALYLALGVDMAGQKELLGMWLGHHEGAKFWLSVFTELHNRGLKDIFIAWVDELTGLPEAIETLYPHTHMQLLHGPVFCAIRSNMSRTNIARR